MSRFYACVFCPAIALLTLAPLAARAASDPVPRLNVQQSCRDAQAVSVEGERRDRANENPTGTYDACMQDETQAHNQLAERWSKFKPANRQSCLAQGIRPSPSYVEILTCLEMNDESGIPARLDSGSGVSPSTAVGSPPARPVGSPSPRGARRL